MNGTPVRLFDTWIHYLPDERLAPVNLSEEEIIAWETQARATRKHVRYCR